MLAIRSDNPPSTRLLSPITLITSLFFDGCEETLIIHHWHWQFNSMTKVLYVGVGCWGRLSWKLQVLIDYFSQLATTEGWFTHIIKTKARPLMFELYSFRCRLEHLIFSVERSTTFSKRFSSLFHNFKSFSRSHRLIFHFKYLRPVEHCFWKQCMKHYILTNETNYLQCVNLLLMYLNPIVDERKFG